MSFRSRRLFAAVIATVALLAIGVPPVSAASSVYGSGRHAPAPVYHKPTLPSATAGARKSVPNPAPKVTPTQRHAQVAQGMAHNALSGLAKVPAARSALAAAATLPSSSVSAKAKVKPQQDPEPTPTAPYDINTWNAYQPGYVSWEVYFNCDYNLADKFSVSMYRTSDNALMTTWTLTGEGPLEYARGVDTSGTSVVTFYSVGGFDDWLIDDYSGMLQSGVSYYAQVNCQATAGDNTVVIGPSASSPSANAIYTPGIPSLLAGECDCAYQNTAGDPVNTATGAALESADDVTVPGAGTPFALNRSYRSDSTTSGLSGDGWQSAYESSLAVASDSITLTDSDQTQVIFTENADGSYSTPKPVRYTLAAVSGGYTVTALDNSSRTYDSIGRLTAEDDASGKGLTIAYTAGDKIASVTDAEGRTSTFTEDPTTGLLTTVALADGRTVTYAYTGSLLTSATDANGRTTTYTYDASGRLATIKDPDGHLLTQNTYDSGTGRVSSQIDASGKTWTFAWTPTPNSPPDTGESDLTDPSGGIWTDDYQSGVLIEHFTPTDSSNYYSYDQNLDAISSSDLAFNQTYSTFDAKGNVLTSTSGGNTTTYTYNADNQVLSRSDGLTNATHYVYDANKRLVSQTDPLTGTISYTYAAAGQLASMTKPGGQTTSTTYDSNGNPISVTDPTGAVTTYTYDSAGRVLTKVDPLGNVAGADASAYTTTYTYDSAGDLLSERDPDGDTTTYTYDADGHVLTRTDPAGAKTTYTYDAAGHVLTTEDALGKVTTNTYDNNGNLLSSTDPLGNETTYTYDGNNHMATKVAPLGNVPGADPTDYTTSYSFDGNGNQTSVTNALGATSYTYYNAANEPTMTLDNLYNTTITEYDADNRPVSVTDPLNNVSSTTYDADGNVLTKTDALNNTTTYTYDANGNKLSQTDATGAKTTYTYDADGRLLMTTDPRGNASGATAAQYTTTNVYDIQGRLLSTTDPLGNVTSYTYDADGLKLSETDPLGNETTYAYDADQRLTSTHDPLGNTTSTAYDADGHITSTTDGLGNKTTFTYDDDGHKLSTTSPRGNLPGADAATYTTNYAYDADGNQVTVTDPTGAVTTTVYDALGERTGVSDPLHNNTVTTYDAVGNVLTVTDPTGAVTTNVYDADRHVTSTTNALNNETQYTYDADGNKSSTVTPLGGTTTWTYDAGNRLLTEVSAQGNATGATASQFTTTYAYDLVGNLASVTDPLGDKSSATFDADNRKVSTTDPLGNTTSTDYDADGNAVKSTDPLSKATSFAFDADRNLITRTDPLNHVTSYTYDADQHQLTTTNPLSETVTNTYDADGNLATVEDARGITTTYTVDARDLTTSITYSDNTPSVTYTYNAGRQKTGITDGTGSRTQTFDPDGRVLTVSLPGSATQGFAYVYNTGGQLASRTYPDGDVTSYTYDDDGHIETQASDGGTVTYTYNPDGELLTTTLPGSNGYVETRTYDDAGQLTGTATANSTSTLVSTQSTLNAAGQPTEVDTVRAGVTQPTQYDGYDADGRLTTWCVTSAGSSGCTGTAVTTYVYDEVGERTSQVANGATTSYTYNAADELTGTVTGSTSTTLTYDQDGDLTDDDTNTIVYDANRHPLTATVGSKSIAFTNDDEGNRVTTTVNGTVASTNAWDTNNALVQLATTTTGTGTLVGDYHTDPNGLPQSEHTPSGAYFDSHDNLGSVVDVTNASGAAQISYSYDPYGTQTATTVPGVTAPITPYAFAGQLADPQLSGTLDLRARDYTPATGRFTSPDPIELRPEQPYTSTYTYADDEPTDEVDPTGADPTDAEGSSELHTQASLLAYLQLTNTYGFGKVYVDVAYYWSQGSPTKERIDVGTPVGAAPAWPDLLAYTSDATYVWEVKPANAKGRSDGAAQMSNYLALMRKAGVNAQPGPDITPETWFFPTLSANLRGYWLSIFSASDWAGLAPGGDNFRSTFPGLIFYNDEQYDQELSPDQVPVPSVFPQPVKVAAPGVLPSLASAQSCAKVDGILDAVGLGTGVYIVGGQVLGASGGWAALGDAIIGGISEAGDWLIAWLEADILNFA